MKENAVNWDSIPEIITKDQLYRICHISKSTALYLLKSGKIPCEYTGKRTRCYKIKKADVIAYLKDRKVFPESYSAPAGWYSNSYPVKMQSEVPPVVREDMHDFYAKLLSKYPDVLMAEDIVKLTGYAKTTVNSWCRRGHLKSFKKNGVNRIPKVYLIEFFCSPHFRTIVQKSRWHIYILKEFARQRKLL